MPLSLKLWHVKGSGLQEVVREGLNDPGQLQEWITTGAAQHDVPEWTVDHPGHGKSAVVKHNDATKRAAASIKKFEEIKRLAETGDASAQAALGFMYELGIHTPADNAEAIVWYWKAAHQGNARAQSNLRQIASFGTTYDRGARPPADPVKACRKAADGGDARAQFNLGQMFEWGDGLAQDHAEAFKWYRKAAEQGVPAAQFHLGECYCNGQGVQQNTEDAVKWWSDAAVQGDPNAQFKLGLCYCNGQGVAQDYAEAVKWYHEAAIQGDAKAQGRLGDAYYIGLGVAADHAEAMKWYEEAAEHGDASAQRHLGIMYGLGQGVPRDFVEAYKWYDIAAAQHDANAIHNRNSLAASMTEAQIEEAKRLSKEFLAHKNGAAPPRIEQPDSPVLPAELETTTATAPSIAKNRGEPFLGIDLMPIAREIVTIAGGRIDLLAIDGNANLVVLMLKRNKAARDLLGETLEHASWVGKLTAAEIDAMTTNFTGKPLGPAFREHFGSALPDSINARHSMIMLAPEFDESSERVVRYLARKHDVPIRVLLVSQFKTGTNHFIGQARQSRNMKIPRSIA